MWEKRNGDQRIADKTNMNRMTEVKALMLKHKKFDVDIERRVSTKLIRLPDSSYAEGDGSFGGNHQYMDLQHLTWAEARRVFDLEARIFNKLDNSKEAEFELCQIENELHCEFDNHLYGLDLGVASTVIALSAVGCIPVSSCNAGAFGGTHYEEHPLVAFYASRALIPSLLDTAAKSGAGLENSDAGMLIVYANDIRVMRVFAQTLIAAGT